MPEELSFERKEICDGIVFRFKRGFILAVTGTLFPASNQICFTQNNPCVLKILGTICGKQEIIARSSTDPIIVFPPVIYNGINAVIADKETGKRTVILALNCLPGTTG